jgi:hypothetical protein
MLAEQKQHRQEIRDDQLLKLYWNRAGVKRELANLKRERFELLDRLKDQESTISRAQEQLEGLERLLTNPGAAANAMVYFQLRHMWRVAALKVAQFSKELCAQRHRRERAQLHGEVLAKRTRRLSAIQDKLNDLLIKRKGVIEERVVQEDSLRNMNAVTRFFKGPQLGSRIKAERKNQAVLDERVTEFNELSEKIQGEPLPEPDGLGLESRRLINIAVIVLAQHLVWHFSEHNLASLAKTATQRPVADMKFGDRRTCDRMVELIRERVADLDTDTSLADCVKARTDYLVNNVSYRHDTDTVPRAECVVEVQRSVELLVANGGPTRRTTDIPLPVNVLADEYWDLYPKLV